MDIRIKAGLKLVAFLAVAGTASVAVQLVLSALTPETALYALGTVIGAGVLYQLYGIILANERYKETLKK